MGTGEGLADGARVAVVGGGISAVAFAAALGIAGRLRGRTFSIHVHDGEAGHSPRGAVLLTPACRTHLAALGCRVPSEWCQRRFSGVELHQGGRVLALPAPPAPSWWLPDSAPLRQALAASASMHGAVFLGRRVEAWHHGPAREEEGARRGTWVVRGSGRSDRYHAVVIATGARSPPRPEGWRAHRPPPGMASLQVRLRGPVPEGQPPVRMLLLPAPGTTLLELYPETSGWFARAWGPALTTASLGRSLLGAFEQGALPEGLEPGLPDRGWLPAGTAPVLAAEGRLAVGEAALGHPLEQGLTTLLESCSSAAHALVAHGPSSAAMVHAHGVEGLRASALRARDAVRAVRWVHRAGERALDAFAEAVEAAAPWGTTTPGCLGLPAPTPRALGNAAASTRRRQWARTLISPAVPSLPRPRPVSLQPHVIVVEPVPTQAMRLAEALAARGATASVLPDALSLLRELGANWPAAIVLGRHLPWMDPVSMCQALRAHPGGATLPVVVLGDEGRTLTRRAMAGLGAVWLTGDDAEPDSVARLLVPEPLPAWDQTPDATAHGT